MKNFNQLTTALNVAKASTTTNKKGFCINDNNSFLHTSILIIFCLVFMLLPASKAQVSMVDRPQAVNHQTNTMQLDGLFDVSLGLQRICVYIRNDGTVPITNVTATASFSANSGIILTDSIETFGTLMPGVAVMGFYTANFNGSFPDKHLLSLQVTGTSFSQSVSRHLFVLKSVNIDSTSWISYLPEGSIKTQILSDHYNGTLATLAMPKDFIWTVDYKTPFAGQYGPIAFNDPWWKVAGAITGVVGGLTYVAGGIVKYCGSEKEGELVKDIGTGVGGAGAIVAAADSIDVFRRGQQNTMPLPTEFTLKEEVDMHVNYAPNAGIGVYNYSAQVTWNYKRYTTGNTYLYAETETVYNNIHYTTNRTTTINNTNFNTNNQIVLTASVNGFEGIQNNKGYFIANLYPGNQTKLSQLVRSVVMRDDGHNGDITASDGIYTAQTQAAGLLTNQPMGIYILGYDRNNAPENIDPLQAAIEIGGVLISTPNLNGCEIIADYLIMVMSPINVNITTIAASCYNANNGSATAVAVGGTAPYTYLWSNGQTTANINNLVPGTYTVTVTSANGQSGVQFTTVNQPKPLPVEATIEPPYCNTSGTGSINLTVNNFTPPLSFLWFDGSIASSRSNLLPGAYTVTVTDGAGKCFSEIYQLQASTPYLMQCPSDITVHTLPGNNYAIVNYDIDITNGCQNFITYNLHPPSGSWFNKGVHTVTCQAVDAFGDTSQCFFTVYVNDPEAPKASVKDTTLTLNAQGLLTLNPALLTHSSFDNCGIISSVIEPGILTCSNIGITPVTLTVYDGNNYYWHILTNSIAYYNNGNSLLNTISTTAHAGIIICSHAGFIVTDQDRVRLYNSQGDLLATIFTLGKVTVTLTGDGGFIVTDDGRVRKYDSEGNLQVTIFTTGVVQVITLGDCGFIVVDEGRMRKYDNGGNLQSTIFTTGAVKVVVIPPCDFIVIDEGRVRKYDSEGNLQSTIFTTGTTQVIVTGDGGFIVIDDGRVRKYDNEGNLQATIFTTGAVQVITLGDCGFIVVDEGRVRKYDKDGNLQSTIFTTGAVKVVVIPPCDFIVIDEGRVRKYDSEGNLQSTIFTTGTTQVIVTGDGGFIVIDDGRVRKYDNEGNLQATIFTTGAVQVITLGDCGFIVVDEGRVRKYDKDGNLQSTIFTTGAVKVVVIPPCDFIVIDEGRVRKYDSEGNLQSTIFTTGTTQVIVTGDGGFIVIDDGRVRKYDNEGNLQSTIFTSGNVQVLPDNNGFKIMDDNRVRTYDNQGSLTNTINTTGSQKIVVNKANQATATALINLLNPIHINATVQHINCNGSKSGKITLSVTGNSNPYSYLWSNGKTSKNIGSLAAGTYAVTVTDKNGCTTNNTYEVIQPLPIAISMNKNNVKCGGKSTGKATATVTGGIAPYSFSWNTSPVSTNATATGLSAGTYIVTVTDANGCTKSKSVIITENAPINVVIQPSMGHATAVATGGVLPYTYQWNTVPVQTGATATGLICGQTYTVTVTDAKGCKKTATHIENCNRILNDATNTTFDVIAYPNPTTDFIKINWTGNETLCYTITLTNVLGHQLQTKTIVGNESVLNLADYDNGIYLVSINCHNATVIKRIVLNKE